MTLVHPSIKNLIFDLGGVLLDLHLDKTHSEFARLGQTTVSQVRAQIESSAFFNQYEKGQISDNQFREEVRSLIRYKISDQEIDLAWNAMLGEIPASRLQLLQRLGNQYRIFLLSNTNQIHLDFFGERVRRQGSSLDAYFEKVYYSHLLKMRKPDHEIFEHVLNENQLIADQTLFLDDNLSNLEGAAGMGIQTFHVQHPSILNSLFS